MSVVFVFSVLPDSFLNSDDCSSRSEEGGFKLLQVETFPVVRRVAVCNDGFDVLLGRVAHVPVPSVLRIFGGQASHMLVPVGLGQHRCGCDGREFSVALHYAFESIVVKRPEDSMMQPAIFEQWSETRSKLVKRSDHTKPASMLQ